MKDEIQVGDKAPDFYLPNQEGAVVHLEELRKTAPQVIFFYPKDYTPICTLENIAFRESYQEFVDAGADVVGISKDPPESHAEFCDRLHLPFQLLTDENNRVRNRFGKRNRMGRVSDRVTYVIDRKGIVRHIFAASFRAKKHSSEALNEVIKLQADY